MLVLVCIFFLAVYSSNMNSCEIYFRDIIKYPVAGISDDAVSRHVFYTADDTHNLHLRWMIGHHGNFIAVKTQTFRRTLVKNVHALLNIDLSFCRFCYTLLYNFNQNIMIVISFNQQPANFLSRIFHFQFAIYHLSVIGVVTEKYRSWSDCTDAQTNDGQHSFNTMAAIGLKVNNDIFYRIIKKATPCLQYGQSLPYNIS